jgi:hypothetical protein
MKKKIRETATEILQEYTNCYSEVDEDCLVNMLNRLASDVAREIFAEIENVLKIVTIPCINEEGCVTPLQASYWAIDPNDFAELKKKYESEGEE